jgi:hypothetical protein
MSLDLPSILKDLVEYYVFNIIYAFESYVPGPGIFSYFLKVLRPNEIFFYYWSGMLYVPGPTIDSDATF